MSDFWVKLRGLPYRTTMDDIVEFMSGVKMKGGKRGINFPVSQKNIEWGEAFIELEEEEDLEAAKEKHNQHLGRRYIEVFTSSKADMEAACKQVQIPENGKPKNVPRRNRSRSPLPPRDRITAENYVVRMKGLPFNASKVDIKDFFQGLKILPDGMSILVDENGKALGDAFVQFASYHDAKLAKERTGNKIGHRYVDVFDSNIEEANSEIRRQMEINDIRVNQMEKSPPRSRGVRALDDAPYAEPRRYGRPPFLVNMRGVSLSVRADDVFRFFRPLMPVAVSMKFTSTASEGEADVEFATEDEAYSALSRNRERLGSSHVALSVLPVREEFPYTNSITVPNYDRRDRERDIGRSISSSGRGYADRDNLYPSSRYY